MHPAKTTTKAKPKAKVATKRLRKRDRLWKHFRKAFDLFVPGPGSLHDSAEEDASSDDGLPDQHPRKCIFFDREVACIDTSSKERSQLAQLARTVQRLPPPEVAKALRSAERKTRTREIFRMLAAPVTEGETPRLVWLQAIDLLHSVAAEYGIDPTLLKNPRSGEGWEQDIRKLLARFDFSATGDLNEEEACRLIDCLLERYVASVHERRDGMLGIGSKCFEELYTREDLLGRGAQGAVYRATEKSSGRTRIVKLTHKQGAAFPCETIKSEFDVMRSLDHPRIGRLYDIFEDLDNIYIIGEPYAGGMLEGFPQKAREAGVTLTARWMTNIVKQVLQGVAYLHGNYIIHCDLKEPNIMISNTGSEAFAKPQVVLIDFGLAQNFAVDGPSSGGTPGYAPPEYHNRGLWTAKGDIFSLGTIICVLFSGQPPFPGANSEEIVNKVISAMPNLELVPFASVRDLVESLLHKKFWKRPTIQECLQSEMIKEFAGDDDAADHMIPEDVLKGLQGIATKKKEVKGILVSIANRLNFAEMHKLNETFIQMDENNSGSLTAEEIRKALGATGMETAKVEEIVASFLGSSGSVSYTEFMALMLASKSHDLTQQLRQEFKYLDKANSGYLDKDEVKELFKRPGLQGTMDVESLMSLLDCDGDGKITFDEFQRVLTGEPCFGRAGQPSSNMKLVRGQQVEYLSATYNTWMPSAVSWFDPTSGAVMLECKVNCWITPEEQQAQIRLPVAHCPSDPPKYQKGDILEYFSATMNKLIPCTIIDVDIAHGHIKLDCKRDASGVCYWLPPHEHQSKLRRPGLVQGGYPAAPAEPKAEFMKPGDRVELLYQGEWLAGSLVSLDDVSGSASVTCDADREQGILSKAPLASVRPARPTPVPVQGATGISEFQFKFHC